MIKRISVFVTQLVYIVPYIVYLCADKCHLKSFIIDIIYILLFDSSNDKYENFLSGYHFEIYQT